MTGPGIYLDAAATMPPEPEALDASREAMAGAWGDPGLSGRRAGCAADVLEKARRAVAALVGTAPEGVVFTSGGTEACNLAVKGLAAASARRGLVLSAVEPYAVDHPARTLAKKGWHVTRVGVDLAGRVDPEALAREVSEGTALVCVTLAHPVLGTWQDLRPLAEAAHARGALLFADACAAAPFDRVPLRELGADALALSGHHLGGVAGAGALVLKPGLAVRPLIEGGVHEGGLRPGMPALGAVAALGAAAEIVRRSLPGRAGRLRALGLRMAAALHRLSGAHAVGDPVRRIPGHAAFCFEGVDGEALVSALAAVGIEASTGSPCAGELGLPEPSLIACGVPERLARGSVRLSAWPGTTEGEVDRATGTLARALARLRALAPAPALETRATA